MNARTCEVGFSDFPHSSVSSVMNPFMLTLFHNCVEQGFLISEVVVDGGGSDVGGSTYVADGHVRKTVLGEEAFGDFEYSVLLVNLRHFASSAQVSVC